MRLKRAGIITKIVAFALIAYAAVSLVSLRAQIDAAEASRKALKNKVAEKEIANAEREYQLEHSADDDVIADIARDDYGLVMPGEVVIIDGAAEQSGAG